MECAVSLFILNLAERSFAISLIQLQAIQPLIIRKKILSNTWKSNVPVCAFSRSFHFIAKFNFPILNFHICRTIITQIMIKLLLKIMHIFSILVGSRAHAKIFAEF